VVLDVILSFVHDTEKHYAGKFQTATIILICIRHTVSHNTTIFTMSDGLLQWIQLHVSALGMGHHQVVLRLIE